MLFPSPLDMLSAALGKCQNPWGSPGCSHSLPPAMRSKAAQSSRRAPARIMVPVAGAPCSPGALLCLCLSSPQGTLCRMLPFPEDSARPQPDVSQGCSGGAVCVGKMLVLESTEGTGSASCPLEGSVGGAADSGILTTENPQVDQKVKKCSQIRPPE